MHYIDCDNNGNGGLILFVKNYLNPRITIHKESSREIYATLKDGKSL